MKSDAEVVLMKRERAKGRTQESALGGPPERGWAWSLPVSTSTWASYRVNSRYRATTGLGRSL
jgi:hypothetical protein